MIFQSINTSKYYQDSVDTLRSTFTKLNLILDGEPWIRFEDNDFFKLCVPLWDEDSDGGIDKAESDKAVTINDETFGGNLDIINATDFKYLNWTPGKNSWRNGVCGVFKSCNNLKYASLREGTYLRGEMFYDCTSLERVELPAIILDYLSNDGSTFKYCRTLKHLKLPLNKEIYASHYFEESGLEVLEFPNAVTTIGYFSCYKCLSLKEVIVGTGVTLIENAAFNTCPSMHSFYIKAVTPPSITPYTFDNNTCTFYVPNSSVPAYKTATNWNKYASRIFGYDFKIFKHGNKNSNNRSTQSVRRQGSSSQVR